MTEEDDQIDEVVDDSSSLSSQLPPSKLPMAQQVGGTFDALEKLAAAAATYKPPSEMEILSRKTECVAVGHEWIPVGSRPHPHNPTRRVEIFGCKRGIFCGFKAPELCDAEKMVDHDGNEVCR